MIEVLLPFYGDTSLMEQAVASIQAQRVAPTRVLIVDDCSPDPDFARWLGSLDGGNTKVLRHETNLGANATYMEALRLSREEYVVFMGADDVMHPDFIKRSLELIVALDQPDVIQAGVTVIDAAGAPHTPLADRVKQWCRPCGSEPRLIAGPHAARSLLRGNWAYFPSLVWRRESIVDIGFQPGFDVVQDLALIMDVLKRGGRMAVDPLPTFSYRRHPLSDSAVKTGLGSRFAEERAYFAQVAAELDLLGWGAAARAARCHSTSRLHAVSRLPAALRHGDWSSARHLLRHAVASSNL